MIKEGKAVYKDLECQTHQKHRLQVFGSAFRLRPFDCILIRFPTHPHLQKTAGTFQISDSSNRIDDQGLATGESTRLSPVEFGVFLSTGRSEPFSLLYLTDKKLQHQPLKAHPLSLAENWASLV